MYRSLIANVHEIEQLAASVLVRRQYKDGFWRDFKLKPGQSEAWSTAWTGWGLAHTQALPETVYALQKGAQALMGCARAAGWGYNRITDTDADSSAWAIRFLSLISPSTARLSLPSMMKFLDAFGEAHTFLNPNTGLWNGVHSDVTAMVGLALIDANGPFMHVYRIREAILARAQINWPPVSFWWETESYGLVWSVAFLARSGEIPALLSNATFKWLEQHANLPLSIFEKALDLICLCYLQKGRSDIAIWHASQLTATYREYGWTGSASLLVPPQRMAEEVFIRMSHTDSGVMTTSLALASLVKWRRAMNASLGYTMSA